MARKKIGRTFSESVTMARVGVLAVLPDAGPNVVAQSATQQFTVTATDAYGRAVPLPSGSVAWTRSAGAAGTITSGGLFTAGTTPGTYQVTATHTATSVAKSVDVEVSA